MKKTQHIKKARFASEFSGHNNKMSTIKLRLLQIVIYREKIVTTVRHTQPRKPSSSSSSSPRQGKHGMCCVNKGIFNRLDRKVQIHVVSFLSF